MSRELADPRPWGHWDSAGPDVAFGEGASATDERCFGPAALRALLTQIPVGVLLTDREGRLVYENEAARRVLELCPPSGVDVALGWADGLAPSRAAPLRAGIDSALARSLLTHEVVRDDEVELTGADGRPRWLSVSVTPVSNVAGEVEVAVLTIADVTDRKECQAWESVTETWARL
jgi:PAS domain-containing protein